MSPRVHLRAAVNHSVIVSPFSFDHAPSSSPAMSATAPTTISA